jgi:hypothetical protein
MDEIAASLTLLAMTRVWRNHEKPRTYESLKPISFSWSSRHVIPAKAGIQSLCTTTAYQRHPCGTQLSKIRQQGAVVLHKELDHPVKPDDDSGAG